MRDAPRRPWLWALALVALLVLAWLAWRVLSDVEDVQELSAREPAARLDPVAHGSRPV